MSTSMRGYAQFVNISGSPERAFNAFTDKDTIVRWYGVEATVEPRRGGMFRVRLSDGRVRDATIDVWDPGRRLRLIYMPDTGAPVPSTLASGPIVEDVLFDAKPGRTVIRVLGSGVPDSREWDNYLKWLRTGWTYWLNQLKRLIEAEAPEAGR
jgi:uncharacterized protein YndB with AHSA1/START domain